MRLLHQAYPSSRWASQLYRGEPHSWPVALKASGGTPLTSAAAPVTWSRANSCLLAHTSDECPPT